MAPTKKGMESKPVSASRTLMSQLMMPQDANHMGYVHGGTLLSIADKVAYVCASRHAERVCTTAAVDSVQFRSPIRVGQLVSFMASVNYVGTTSMEVGIRIVAEDLMTGDTVHTNSCYFTMVALDAHGKPVPVRPLILETAEDKRRNKAAAARRKFRLSLRRQKGE